MIGGAVGSTGPGGIHGSTQRFFGSASYVFAMTGAMTTVTLSAVALTTASCASFLGGGTWSYTFAIANAGGSSVGLTKASTENFRGGLGPSWKFEIGNAGG